VGRFSGRSSKLPVVNMPKLNDAAMKTSVAEWLKSEGEKVSEGEPIAMLITKQGRNRIQEYLRAEETGRLTHILAAAGQEVPVGSAIAVIENGEGEREQKEDVPKEDRPPTELQRRMHRHMSDLLKAQQSMREFIQAKVEDTQVEDTQGEDTQGEDTQGSTTTTRRLNVVFSESAYDDLKKLADQSSKTISDVVRDAIALQKWFNDVKRGGGRILVEERGRVREILNIR
jgi:pyruvate/2-oxoglutarate dehydrogenase complex dihydrolipoamide acyltransferase (E2) component